MTQKGEHTWDLAIRYHRCPACGYIIESRDDYHYRLGKYEKALTCPKCAHQFIEVKKTEQKLGPLIGEPETASFEWENN